MKDITSSDLGKPDYQRAIQLLRNCLFFMAGGYRAYVCENDIVLDAFRQIELSDEEIEYFGWSYLFDIEEDDEKR